jgi:hypothetical protein
MNSAHFNEHDAHQGARSSGEFLGMTGNSGWYLLGSGGVTILMVIVLWGILGISLLLCLLLGIILGLVSVSYVFMLKNNKPEHYDTDFFESALVEAGVLIFCFGPRKYRPLNPFAENGDEASPVRTEEKPRSSSSSRSARQSRRQVAGERPAEVGPVGDAAKARPSRPEETVPHAAFEQLQERLTCTEDLLEEASAERGED